MPNKQCLPIGEAGGTSLERPHVMRIQKMEARLAVQPAMYYRAPAPKGGELRFQRMRTMTGRFGFMTACWVPGLMAQLPRRAYYLER